MHNYSPSFHLTFSITVTQTEPNRNNLKPKPNRR